MPRLLVEKGPDRGKSITIQIGQQVIAGRDKSANLQLSDNMASRRHFMIASKGSVFGLKDLNSANGTLVNGKVPEGAHKLVFGDSIQIGETLISWLPEEQTDERGGLIGQQIGGYRIEKRLGRGAMGTVYKATQLSLGRTVALKVLAPDLTKDEKFCEMFLKEARAAGSLNHPNIIQVYDVGDEDNNYFFSMEYAGKGSVLEELSQVKAIGMPRAVKVIMDACAALDYAEKKGLVHRDIKPDNLMVTEDSTVKLGDLGLAMSAQELQAEQDGVFGTPHYIAPEQAMGKPIDHRADIYALGATFYRMLTGRTLFQGTTVKEILKKQVREAHTPITDHMPDCPQAIATIIDRMLAKNPAERYQHASEIAEDLETWQALAARKGAYDSGAFGSKVSGLPPEESQMIGGAAQKQKLVIAGVVAFICVLAAVGSIWFFAFSGNGGGESNTIGTGNTGANNPPPANNGSDGGTELSPEVLEANDKLKAAINVAEYRLREDNDPDLKEYGNAIADLQDAINQYPQASEDVKQRAGNLVKSIEAQKKAYEESTVAVLTAWEETRKEALELIEQFKFKAGGEKVTAFIQLHPDFEPAKKWMDEVYQSRCQERMQTFGKEIQLKLDAASKEVPELRVTLVEEVYGDVKAAEEACDDPTYTKRIETMKDELKENLLILRMAAERAKAKRINEAFERASASLGQELRKCTTDIARGNFARVNQRLLDWELTNEDYAKYKDDERFEQLIKDMENRRKQTELEHAALRALEDERLQLKIIQVKDILKESPWPEHVLKFLGSEQAKFFITVKRDISDDQWSVSIIPERGSPYEVDIDSDEDRIAFADALSHLIMSWTDLRDNLMDDAGGLPALVGLFAWMSEMEAYDAAFPLIKHAFDNTSESDPDHALIREYFAWGLLGKANAHAARDEDAQANALLRLLETRFADTRANKGR